MRHSFAKDSRIVLICRSGDRRTYLISPRSGNPDRAEPASAALAAQMSVGCWRPLAAAVARSCVSLVTIPPREDYMADMLKLSSMHVDMELGSSHRIAVAKE